MEEQDKKYMEKAARLQKSAEDVMDTLQICQLWGKVGKVILVGSARFGLMASPNLDFEIYVDEPDINIGFETIKEFANVPGVKQIQFLNLMGTEDPGLYWRIDYEDAHGTMWDIDNWLVPFSHPHAGMADAFAQAIQKALTEEKKLTILQIKACFSPKKKYRGIDIYKAGLSGGVTSVEEFEKWIEENPPVPMETWSPSPRL